MAFGKCWIDKFCSVASYQILCNPYLLHDEEGQPLKYQGLTAWSHTEVRMSCHHGPDISPGHVVLGPAIPV